MAWTKEQSRAIDAGTANILVSAAAGSGKTAVLVERILKKIINDKCSIDDFLVVTFTNAAAAQMRDKLAARLEAALAENPFDELFMKQVLLVNRADITTIDSFCLKLVKENFGILGLDSSFSIGDPGMMELVKSDVLDEVFKEKYEGCDEQFLYLMEIFGRGADDADLKKLIFRIFNVAESFSEPDVWIRNAKEALLVDDPDKLDELPWVKDYITLVKSTVTSLIYDTEELIRICNMPGGPYPKSDAACADLDYYNSILDAEDYDGIRNAINKTYKKAGMCKGTAYDKELTEQFNQKRDMCKKTIKDINIFTRTREEICGEIADIRRYLLPLLELVEEFTAAYDDKKRRLHTLTFSDIEHLAYKLVCTGHDETGRAVPSEIGTAISKRYKEIYIDEYQDSNFLQEDILTAVSGAGEGMHNIFMVGDIKQSIYRFRMARPDLFNQKYMTYGAEGDEIKIELKHNFRSRDVVLNPVNFFFYQLMGYDLGKISYDKNIALVPGRVFPDAQENSDRISSDVEIIAIDSNDENFEGGEELDEEAQNLDKINLEAHYIAKRILELTDPEKGMYVYDDDREEYRLAGLNDIVILSRGLKGFGEITRNVLSSYGIPVIMEEPKGYFDTTEIMCVMSLLMVVDNSRQDIPLAAFLTSPMSGLTENELTCICAYANTQGLDAEPLYEKCIIYLEDVSDGIADRLRRSLEIVDKLKDKKNIMTISELIYEAFALTGYYEYASAMPMGAQRRANLDLFIEKAHAYENGCYKGLFNFLRYIEKMIENNMDFGEAPSAADGMEAIKIVTMHKSKGLEYPIVFVSCLGKNFNNMESREPVIIHSDYYMAGMIMNTDRRFKSKTVIREALKKLIKQENMAEELRILYVALTRAKEKLILTGCDKDVTALYDRLGYLRQYEDVLLPYVLRKNSKNFLSLILACMKGYERLGEHLDVGRISLEFIGRYDVMSKALEDMAKKETTYEGLLSFLEGERGEQYDELRASFEYAYPYSRYVDIKSKMPISEIKKMKAYDGQGYDVTESMAEEKDSYAKANAGSGLTGAQRGTLVHKFMELLPFDGCIHAEDTRKYIEAFLEELVKKEIFTREESAAINCTKMDNMINSNLGRRMAAAQSRGELFKEQQFSMGFSVDEIYQDITAADKNTDDVVIVQGIVDAFFYENNEIILMDYKTDAADRDEICARYKAQLDYYAEALERLTGRCVREKIIYSFYNQQEIYL